MEQFQYVVACSQNSKISQWSGDFLADQFNTTLKSTCTEHQVYTWLFLLFLLLLLYLIVYYTKWKREKKRKEMKLSPTRGGMIIGKEEAKIICRWTLPQFADERL